MPLIQTLNHKPDEGEELSRNGERKKADSLTGQNRRGKDATC